MKQKLFGIFLIILFPFLCNASSDVKVNSVDNYAEGINDSLSSYWLVSRSFWTQWGPLSNLWAFAEINFNSDYTFRLLIGQVNNSSTPNDSTIYRSYHGIWTVKDSVVTLISSGSKSNLNNEESLRIIGINKLEIVSGFSTVKSHVNYFTRKPIVYKRYY